MPNDAALCTGLAAFTWRFKDAVHNPLEVGLGAAASPQDLFAEAVGAPDARGTESAGLVGATEKALSARESLVLLGMWPPEESTTTTCVSVGRVGFEPTWA